MNKMFHKAINLTFKDGTVLEVTFQDGKIKQFDMAALFSKYPQLEALKDRKRFCAGKLSGFYGIRWDDDLDIETETIYEEGATVGEVSQNKTSIAAGKALLSARAEAGITQKQLSERSGIDQSDISKIERGLANPSVETLGRLARALGRELRIEMV